MCKVLACDLDGTLFYPRGVRRCISKKNVRFLRRWYDAGNKIVLVTSRAHAFTEKLKKEIQRPFDTLNFASAQMYHDDQLISDTYMPNKDIKAIFDEIETKYKPLGYMLNYEADELVAYNPKRSGIIFTWLVYIWYFFQFKYREPGKINNEKFLDAIENHKPYKLVTFFGFGKKKRELSKEINKQLRSNFPSLESSWSIIVNEITPKGCNKGDGLVEYCRKLNINHDDVYVVGDSGNDISMFNAFHEHSYCMAHAYPSVKKYAKHVITRVHKLDKLVLKGEEK